MKKFTLITLSLILFSTVFYFWKNSETESTLSTPMIEKEAYPLPTDINISSEEKMREESESQEKREAWIESMHQTAPGTNWRAIEARNRFERHQKRVAKKYSANYRGGGEEILADGNLIGEWVERGSNNQAGRVMATEYDPVTDEIWLISDGGTIFKGPRDGSDWQVVNDDLRFNDNFLKAIPHNGSRRWLVFIDKIPHYSDDEGVSWTPSSGISYDESSGGFHEPIVLDDANNSIYFLQKKLGSGFISIYHSIDHGETFSNIHTFQATSFNTLRLKVAHNSNAVYAMFRASTNKLNLYKVDSTQVTLIGDTGITLGGGRVNFTATVDNTDTILYTMDNVDTLLYASMDGGQTWENRGKVPIMPWGVGIYVLKTDPNILYTGNIECYTSADGGATWFKMGNWWDYYDDVEYSIHADMMYFNEFQTADNQRFLLISNDGGLTISNDQYYNFSNGYQNIALEKLNISQYYDVRSDLDPSHHYIYAGSQDQGMQRAFTFFSNEEILDFEQVISGDYGHISFSLGGDRMWAVYPGGTIHYYHDPQVTGINARYKIDSDDESPAWIPSMMDAPDQSQNHVFVIGGSAEGGSGSYIIELERIQAQDNSDSIQASNLPFNFKGAGFGTLTAIASSKIDFNRWYAATNTGRVLTSDDYGQTWTAGNNNIPNGHYLYGQTILPSKIDLETVYIGGSGYNNAAVEKSTNGGQTFFEMGNGLPSTLVFDLATNADESLIFAATEAGPYVYVVAEDLWYDMAGMYAPAQTYWSVEYLEEDNIARFGTYGRGIWDFQITIDVANQNFTKEKLAFKVYPNPSNGIIQVEWNDSESKFVTAQLFDISGKMVLEKTFENHSTFTKKETLDLTNLSTGNYFLKLENNQKIGTEKITIVK